MLLDRLPKLLRRSHASQHAGPLSVLLTPGVYCVDVRTGLRQSVEGEVYRSTDDMVQPPGLARSRPGQTTFHDRRRQRAKSQGDTLDREGAARVKGARQSIPNSCGTRPFPSSSSSSSSEACRILQSFVPRCRASRARSHPRVAACEHVTHDPSTRARRG